MLNKVWFLYYLNTEQKRIIIAHFRTEEEARYYLMEHKKQLPLYNWGIDFIDFETNVKWVNE